jgi:hypothetical protein
VNRQGSGLSPGQHRGRNDHLAERRTRPAEATDHPQRLRHDGDLRSRGPLPPGAPPLPHEHGAGARVPDLRRGGEPEDPGHGGGEVHLDVRRAEPARERAAARGSQPDDVDVRLRAEAGDGAHGRRDQDVDVRRSGSAQQGDGRRRDRDVLVRRRREPHAAQRRRTHDLRLGSRTPAHGDPATGRLAGHVGVPARWPAVVTPGRGGAGHVRLGWARRALGRRYQPAVVRAGALPGARRRTRP